jgi:hypothetical protein
MEEQSPARKRSSGGTGGSSPEVKAPPPILFQPPSPSSSAESAPSADAATGRIAKAAPAKKTPAKKTVAKKTVARKTVAKKTPAKVAATKAPAKKVAGKKGPATRSVEEPAAVTEAAEQTPAKATRAPRKKAAPHKDAAALRKKAAPSKEAARRKKAAPSKEAAPRKKAGPRTIAVPKQPGAEDGHAEPAHPVIPAALLREVPSPQAPAVHRSTQDPRQIVVRLLVDPAHAPELLAVTAVRLIGPRAAAWADAVRSAYPGATDEGLARLATRRFVRLAAAGGLVSAGAGVFGPAAELATAALARAGLVLHLAAAHGHDPAHPDRAAELLVLTQVHADESAARAALKAAAEGQQRAAGNEPPPVTRAVEAGLRLAVPLAAETGGWAVLRLAARVVPGARVIAATAGQAAAAERLATRASAYYRRARAS